ncbi:MAG: AAA family ATPase [Planctomycetota bacterium]
MIKFKFKNFGPIEDGEYETKSLTVLIGPNQSGKSFAALLTHAAMRAIAVAGIRRRRYYPYDNMPFIDSGLYSYRGRGSSRRMDNLESISTSLVSRVSDLKKNEFSALTRNELKEIENLHPVGQFKAAFIQQIEDAFSSDLKSLKRHNSKSGSIAGAIGDLEFSLNLSTGEVITNHDIIDLDDVFIAHVDRRRREYKAIKDGVSVELSRKDLEHYNQFPTQLLFDILSKISKRVPNFRSISNSSGSIYVPAIRSGLLLSHRLFLSLLVRNASRFGFEPVSIPQMTGVVSEFLQSLVQMPDNRYSFNKISEKRDNIVAEFEERINGGLVVPEDAKAELGTEALSNLVYRTQEGLELPLNLVSSTVQETAPIFLMLKNRMSLRQWIVIEEPEAHLSPQNQRLMAKFLASLIHSGQKIIITTHSTFLLEQLNTEIFFSGSGKKKKRISHDDIAVVNAAQQEVGEGSKLRQISVTESEGIDMSTFTDVYEEIYNEQMDIKAGK